MIKKFVLAFMLMAANGFAVLAINLSEEMQNFLNGCVAMRQAVEENDFTKLTDAKILLSKIELGEFIKGEDFFPIDEKTVDAIGDPQIIFTPEYASKLSREGKIVLKDLMDVHLMRGINELSLWHASIMPGSEIALKGSGVDDCEMLLFGLTGSGLKLRVLDGNMKEQQVEEIAGDAWLAKWFMPDEGEFQFLISNESDNPQTFVIAIN